MASATDVPSKYDLVYTVGATTYGHVFDRTRESTLYGSRARAEYGYTATFIERQNISGSFGDNQQDFFLTESSNDWDYGEGQYFLRPGDSDSMRRYYVSNGVFTGVPGRASLRPKITTPTIAASILAACGRGAASATDHAYVSLTNLYTLTSAGVQTDQGAHGAGDPGRWCMCSDGVNLFISGTASIRKWTGAAFSTFSATANAGALVFLNNALYSCNGSTLRTYDTAGSATTLFTWKDAAGTALSGTNVDTFPRLIPYGGKLLIFHPYLTNGPELWIYDGVSTSKVATLPRSSMGKDAFEVNGVIFMSVLQFDAAEAGGTPGTLPAIYFWANGTFGKLWREDRQGPNSFFSLSSQGYPALGTVGGKLLFTDSSLNLKEYDPASGSITTVGVLPPDGSRGYIMSSSTTTVFVAPGGTPTTGGVYPDSTLLTSSAILCTSGFDFDSSLTKQFRSVKVDWTGNGSVDIGYTIGTIASGGSAGTPLQTGAVSGTEYLIPNGPTSQGRTISIQVKLNAAGGAGSGPTVTRVYVRASPVLQSFRTRSYNLDLSSTPNNPTWLNDGSTHPLTGHEQATALISAITSSTPISITDRFGTYTGVLEPDKSTVLEIHSDSGGGVPANSGQFIASVFAREV